MCLGCNTMIISKPPPPIVGNAPLICYLIICKVGLGLRFRPKTWYSLRLDNMHHLWRTGILILDLVLSDDPSCEGLQGNANANRRRREILKIWTFSYREMLIQTAGGGKLKIWTFPYRGMLIQTAGGGKSLNFRHFPIGEC